MKPKIPEYLFGKPVKGALERALALKEKPVIKQHQKQIILSSNDFWTIPDVNYRNKTEHYDLSKTLLPAMNQDDASQYSQDNFHTADMILYHSIFHSLLKGAHPEKEEIRKFLQENMRVGWLMTLTRIRYTPKGKDKVIHNYKTPNEYSLEENITGSDRYIEASDNSALSALTSFDSSELNQIYQWINQTDGYIWRVNSKPKNIDEMVARLYSDSDRVDLVCDGSPDGADPSFGVRRSQKISP